MYLPTYLSIYLAIYPANPKCIYNYLIYAPLRHQATETKDRFGLYFSKCCLRQISKNSDETVDFIFFQRLASDAWNSSMGLCATWGGWIQPSANVNPERIKGKTVSCKSCQRGVLSFFNLFFFWREWDFRNWRRSSHIFRHKWRNVLQSQPIWIQQWRSADSVKPVLHSLIIINHLLHSPQKIREFVLPDLTAVLFF